MSGSDADALRAALSQHLGGTVHDLRRLSGGASRTTWAFEHSAPGDGHAVPTQPFIVQVARVAPTTSTAATTSAYTMADEATLLEAAARVGVPVPAVAASGPGGDDGFPAPWIVAVRVPGETIPRKLLRDPEYEHARHELPRQAAAALAAIHAIPLSEAGRLGGGDQLEQFADILHAFEPARPALELALRRLRALREAHGTEAPVTVVHGDFRTGNLLVGPEGLRAVLDWELAHTGDPLEDLGWFCVRVWRFGGPGRAGGFGSDADFIAAYEQASGTGVDRDAVRWWEAVGTFKWAVMCMIQASAYRAGGRSSVELATIGRRVCESEWDLLRLLGAHAPDEPVLTAATSSGDPAAADELFGRPTAADLLEAVRRYVAEDLVTETEGRVQFNVRVAATALGIVGRQLALQEPVVARQRSRLAGLGFRDDAALVTAIRNGDCDARFDEVAGALLASVADQLAVSNPQHLDDRTV